MLRLTIAGNELSDYKIIYAKSPYSEKLMNEFGQEYDFYRLTAEDIAAKLAAVTGISLSVIADSEAEAGSCEILVGPTNRPESAVYNDMDVYLYKNTVTGGKLIIGGGYNGDEYSGGFKKTHSFGATYHSFNAVYAILKDELEKGSESYDIAEGTDISGEVDLITVACVGDSITWGVGAVDWETDCYLSYPAVLGRLLWQDYLVINYGLGGTTMRDDLAAGYRKFPQYNAAIEHKKYFDYALIMLGTNDSYSDLEWNEEADKSYYDSAVNLAGALTSENPDMQLVIMNCPAYYGNLWLGMPHVLNLQNKLPALLSDNNFKVSFFDMNTLTAEGAGKEHFPDLLHPDDEGYQVIAKGICEMLTAIRSGTYTYTLPADRTDLISADMPPINITCGSENLYGIDFITEHPYKTGLYGAWYLPGAPYILMNQKALQGKRITDIEIPVFGCRAGDTFTVSVVKYDCPTITETLSVHVLETAADAGSGWINFTELNIEVPDGYILSFGDVNDTIPVLFYTAVAPGFEFYSGPAAVPCTNVGLAFNFYGVPLK